MKLTHFDEEGKARMVDVSGKPLTEREAVAGGSVSMKPETVALIKDRRISKGDVLGVARVAGIMAAKRTADLIPMCHPLNISSVTIDFTIDEERSRIDIRTTVKITGQTGVEMEALTAATVAALTIYDMCKAADKDMVISGIMLLEKRGGKSGEFRRRG
ncbi:MAG: cyclic pyranopterin monophosphate synthase MoaC [Alphaproteobacteria bacterium]|uniref:Cyclic pyranopterin monophosphate synthase n=1 Tax=Candidatus Nitrobium versatile TaxID=2884831 RepID=A0A953J4S4_9BACT|nr:cyclic pyranopterin monophosphate synthase MoaC [Candidatus Nitrobium versatile]